MPCNLGYREIAEVTIPNPQPQELKEEVVAPEIDKELLEKIGEEDSIFLDWLLGLEIGPLLEEALRRALSKVKGAGALKTSIAKNGRLLIRARYTTAAEKKELDALTVSFSNQFQMEALAIVAELLDYEVLIRQEIRDGKKVFVLEGEKKTSSGIHKYLKITRDVDGKGVLVFEHFEFEDELTKEERKFLALAKKLGIRIVMRKKTQQGNPLPKGVTHKNFVRAR